MRYIAFGVAYIAAVVVATILYGMTSNGATLTQAVTLSGNTAGGGIPSFVGPNYRGSIPAAALAAGFNTVVLNMDISDSTPFTYQGATVSWPNISTWLDCAGAPQPIWLLDVASGPSCSDFSIVTDTDGQTSLASVLTPAEYNANPGEITDLQSATPWMFPNNVYFEDTKRVDQNSLNNPPQGSGVGPFWVAPYYGAAVAGFRIGNPRNWVEWDHGEWISASSSAGDNYVNQTVAGEFTTDGSCTQPGQHCGFYPLITPCCTRPYSGFGSYNVQASRISSDTAGNFAQCAYSGLGVGTTPAQNTPGGCQTYQYIAGASDPAITNTNYILYPYTEIGVPGYTLPVAMRVLLRKILILSCSKWQTTACNTGVVTSNP